MARRPTVILKNEHKAFLVQRLAVFDSPGEAVDALKAEFGLQISPQRAEAYSPLKRAGERLGERWRQLFEVTRKRFLEHLEEIPEANKAVRVRHLAHAARAYKSKGNFIGMASMLEQISKEIGGAFTNRRELTGREGKPIEARFNDYSEMSDEQLNAQLAALAERFRLVSPATHVRQSEDRSDAVKRS